MILIPGLLLGGSIGFNQYTASQVATAQSDVDQAQVAAHQRSAKAAASLQARQAANAAAATASAAQKSQDDAMKDQGYSPASKDLYFRFAPDKNFTCGSVPCAAVYIYTFAACASGVYIAASIMDGSSSVGFTNKITGALSAASDASAMLENYLGYGTSFKITDVHCMG
ncbi:hypothetical protein QN345_00120 [Cryobacterium sp. 10I1]|uniref:hypothetical protein n=1 Tax=unclassified Cryobacterium TaxID=2649013 RepID=UPI002AC91ED7|nr:MULTISPECIES: hypothetical protein [unclassified Cryobacterium]MEB0286772.1 hypothetical protein [Cryobacterium sp. 10S3]MEB0303743.1 hypothetical protein [Cryobacterium sp. 10I1]WPX12678.1 hypothetical protein RHM57_13460 [Cryobacterium sp. 10S3]